MAGKGGDTRTYAEKLEAVYARRTRAHYLAELTRLGLSPKTKWATFIKVLQGHHPDSKIDEDARNVYAQFRALKAELGMHEWATFDRVISEVRELAAAGAAWRLFEALRHTDTESWAHDPAA